MLFRSILVDILNQNRATDRNQNYVPDVSKFKNKFELYQNIDLKIAIQKTIEYYKNNKEG